MVSMPHWPKKVILHPDIKDLSRNYKILDEIGNPHLKLPPVIHIAGTNGKGSSCAMLKSIFESARYKVHMYTSPHIVHFNERIVIAGHKIDDQNLYLLLEEVRIACESIDFEPTFFEAVTAAAFLAFSRENADIIILETGMGGRLDPTNVIENPLLTIITPISYDHMEYLGPEIGIIAREKAGIIKPKVPCVIGRQDERVMDILLEKCEEKESPSIAYEYDYIPEKHENGFKFLSRLGDLDLPLPNLAGDHQIINASAVIAASLFLRGKYKTADKNIKYGLTHIDWPGRIQKVSVNHIIKTNKNITCYADGAHNLNGIASLVEWLKQQDFEKLTIIVGFTNNRDVASLMHQFRGINAFFISVKVMSELSSYSADKIAELSKEAGISVIPFGGLLEALDYAVNMLDTENIIVTGSLFLVSDLLKL